MGTKTSLSEYFEQRPHFTSVPAASDLRFYIECQVVMIAWLYAWLFAFIICNFGPTMFLVMFHHFTALAVFSQVRSTWLRFMIRYDRWIRVRTLVLYSLMDISMLFLAPLCLARPAVTPLPSSDSLLTERLFLIAQASLSIFGSFRAQHDGRSRIIYLASHALGISAVHAAGTAAQSSEDWCAVLIKTFDQNGPWLPRSHVYCYHRAAKNSVRAVENVKEYVCIYVFIYTQIVIKIFITKI